MSTRRAASEGEPLLHRRAFADRTACPGLREPAIGPRLRATALALLTAFGSPAQAQDAARPFAATPQASDEEMIVQVRSNGVARGEFTLLRKANGDIWVRASDLPRMQIQPREEARREQGSETWYSTAALGAARVALDEPTLTLDVDFRAEAFEGSRVDLSARRPRLTPAEPRNSLVMSYRLSVAQPGRAATLALLDTAVDARISGVLLRQETHFNSAAGARHMRRGMTQAIHDDRVNGRRYVAGDLFSTAGAYGSSITGAGLLLQKVYELTPDVVRQPTATLQASTTLPADVEVAVDGSTIYRGRVAPGPIVFNNLLLSGGTRNLRVTVTDIAGHRQVFEQPFLFSDTVLAKGYHEYSYFAGKRSQLAEDGRWQYLEPAWQAYHRYGVTDHLTVGAGGEGNADFHTIGSGITLRSDKLGLLSADLLSNRDRVAGTQARGWSARYTYQSAVGALVLARRRFGEHFRSFVASELLFPREETRLAVSTSYRRLGLSADWVRTHTASEVRDARFLRLSTFVANNVNLFAEYQTTRINGLPSWSLSVFLRADLDPRRWVSTGTKAGSDARTLEVSTGQQLPQGEGFGYRVGLLSDFKQATHPLTATAAADWHLRDASVSLFALAPLQDIGTTFLQGTVAGALAGIDGYWGFTRQVNDAFALVKLGVPQKGVEVFLNNQSQGRTDAQGRLFVPELNSIGRQDISVSDRDLDIQYSLPQRRITIVPAYHSGHVVDFGIRQVRAVTGTAWIVEKGGRKPVVARAWSMQGPAGDLALETSASGEFYLENAPPGSYSGRLAGTGGRTYTCRVTLPEITEPVQEVKEGIVCE